MNAIDTPESLHALARHARTGEEVSAALGDAIAACKVAGFDLILVETSGIGQGDAAIVPLVDVSLYVMTPEFGAASQLEKIDMLDFADFVAINKFDRKGARGRAARRAQAIPAQPPAVREAADEMPVFGTQASRFNDDGVTALYQAIAPKLAAHGLEARRRAGCRGRAQSLDQQERDRAAGARALPRRDRRHGARLQAARGRAGAACARAAAARRDAGACSASDADGSARISTPLIAERERRARRRARRSCSRCGRRCRRRYSGDEYVVKIRDREVRTRLTHETLSGTTIRKVCLPRYEDHGELLSWLMLENVPGAFPFTGGRVRVQARGRGPDAHVRGRGRRVPHQPALPSPLEDMPAKRLSTAFDSVTLYGFDPTSGPTSTARSATRACRSRRSTT